MARLGIITGLRSEARILSATEIGKHHEILVAGADSRRAVSLAEQAVSAGVVGLVSFGLAGGLDPGLSCGDVLLPEVIAFGDQQRQTDTGWRQRLAGMLPEPLAVREDTLAGSTGLLSTPDEKSRLSEGSGAVAVDMESHAVAAVAVRWGVPFIAVRIVADPADQAVPSWMASVIGTDGGVKYGAVLHGVIRQPTGFPGLIRLARYNRKALNVLGRVALAARRDFGFLG